MWDGAAQAAHPKAPAGTTARYQAGDPNTRPVSTSVARGLLPANSLPWELLGLADFFAKHPKGLKPCFCVGPEGWVLQLPPPHGVRAGAAWHKAGTPRAGITDLTACPAAWLTPHHPFVFLGRAPSPREKEEEEERGRRGEGKKESPQKCLHNRKRLIKYLWFGMCDPTGQTMHLAGNPAINAAQSGISVGLQLGGGGREREARGAGALQGAGCGGTCPSGPTGGLHGGWSSPVRAETPSAAPRGALCQAEPPAERAAPCPAAEQPEHAAVNYCLITAGQGAGVG